MSPLSTLSLLILSLLLHLSAANLMAVDLGLGYVKVAVARPGKGLELVTNEQSKRKTPAAVGFTDEGERLFGDAAVAYAAKAPHRAILDGRTLIGECSADDEPGPFCSRRTLQLQGLPEPFTGEEVVAMLLAMAKRQANAYLGGGTVKDVAITVPAWYDERQKQAVTDAARVIGLNCLGVVNANTAAALKYALDGKAKPSDASIEAAKMKDKKKRVPKTITQRVMFYDLGAASACASIAEVTTEVKTGLAQGIKMLGHAWERGVGGKLLDNVVVERLADAFDEQRGEGATPSRSLPRVMQRLRKEAQKVREVLSANTETYVSIASLHDDTDLKTSMTRAQFEEDAEPMLKLVAGPARAVLNQAKLDVKDLDAIVPFGGTSRTPRVQSELCDALGISSLNKSINTDEAAVMGAVYYAASLSSTFRVRKLDFEDVYNRVITAEIEKGTGSGGLFSGSGKKSTQKVEIFPDGAAKMPSKKTLSLNRDNDFGLEVYLGLDNSGRSRYSQRTLYAKVIVKGVADVLKKLRDSSKAKNLTPRVALTFHVDRSGFIRIGTAESSVDETVIVEREVEVKDEKENNTKDGKGKENEKEPGSSQENGNEESQTVQDGTIQENEGEDKETKGGSVDSNSEEETSATSKKKGKKKKTKIEKSSQTIVHRQALKIEYVEGEGLVGMQMSGKQLDAAKKVLNDLEKADIERVERADALNALEGFILEIRSKVRGLDEDDDLYKVSTEEERENLVQAFDDGEDWMYTEDARQTANLRKKHFELKKLFEPMESRARELSGRPDAFKQLLLAADMSLEKTDDLRQLHVERESSKIEEFEKFKEFCEFIRAWVTEKEEEQSKVALTEKPVVTLVDIYTKGMELREEVEKLVKLKIPPPPKASPDGAEDNETVEEELNPVSSEGTADSNSTTADEASNDGELGDSAKDIPLEPDMETAKADAASGIGGVKDEL